ncbi:phage tail protein [Pseudomonas sp. 5P_5.1_Bac1]|uniref:phage tail protein n=1 Tax=Pseudomonas sp. 5P_5.1_Bac1 TaxID=2971616 RepID=UPI0021CA027F|nr:phage tail protein [Pseudomonas sp. 5P_5.1_Bac1]MCU1722325.1 phage tail protein [Pseudomonas sp. 5P_5.1_Bac1]
MTDQNSQFFAILTAVGEAKQANANALGVPWTFAQMGVGDANNTDPVPSRTQTKLINERRRAPLNQLTVDPKNASIIIAEQVIPPDEGGWWIREIGLYDAAGDLVAVANCAPSFKPLLSQGTGKTQVVRLNLIVTSTANVQLKIDPAVVLATRDYIETVIMTVLPPTRQAGTFTKVEVNNRGVVVNGSNPTTLDGYGIADGIKRGEVGLGSSSAPVANADTVGLPGGFYYVGAGENTLRNYVSLLNLPYSDRGYTAQVAFTQGTAEPVMLIRTCRAEGKFGPVREVWHAGNFRPTEKADRATTLAGYGITDTFTIDQLQSLFAKKADKDKALAVGSVSMQQPVLSSPTTGEPTGTYASGALILREAGEVGGTETREMFAPGIGFHWLGNIAGKLVMDSVGKLKWNGLPLLVGQVASQAEVDAGSTDTNVVTPFKLRWGFRMLVGGNGYVVLPKWLGGLILQWGATSAQLVNTIGTTTAYFAYPIQFPSGALFVTTSNVGTSEPRSSGVASNVYDASGLLVSFENARSDQSVAARWFAIGS